MNIKKAILNQKIISRKIIAKLKLFFDKKSNVDEQILKEKKVLSYDFSNINSINDFTNIMHNIKHSGSKKQCNDCKKIIAEMTSDVSPVHLEPEKEENNLVPKFGNLIAILEKNSINERNYIERKRMPSQNDLTRWALKDAVLAYYQGLNMPDDLPIVENRYDDRLIAELAPDFKNISSVWLQKLEELKYKDDKYGLTMDEYDKAESDLSEEMRGSAFEKQLDRYREDFMKQLME